MTLTVLVGVTLVLICVVLPFVWRHEPRRLPFRTALRILFKRDGNTGP